MADGMEVISTNLPEFEKHLQDLSKKTVQRVVDAINLGAVMVHSTAVKSVQKSSGQHKLYEYIIRTINGKAVPLTGIARPKHWSSPPGQPPNSDTGKLASNILVTRRANTTSPIAFVVSRARYSHWLEEGTKKILPRPFMGPALKANEAKIRALVSKALGGAK